MTTNRTTAVFTDQKRFGHRLYSFGSSMKWYLAIEAWSLTQWYLERAGVCCGAEHFSQQAPPVHRPEQSGNVNLAEFRLFIRRLTAAAYFKARYHCVFSVEGATYHSITQSFIHWADCTSYYLQVLALWRRWWTVKLKSPPPVRRPTPVLLRDVVRHVTDTIARILLIKQKLTT